ncbi:hypothetical protein [Allorhodopirellula heiligendammensis]|uniref:Uncharacterized protein n=1 Tax=Allorhodopirellula heiligendammensis TaxID=2714739 RepID=A0A5C6C3M5_9BACT|nr:hypothetical protein [Allorhodopirellula heiligendammensis]TWU18685.1 hypothetical protein Poly21_08500 [Allorhodopirellula heiligendammensis]
MLRSLFLAVGIMLIVIGVESMFIDSANLHAAAGLKDADPAHNGSTPAASMKSWQPGEKFPFAMLAGGAIVVVYSNTLPKRFARG